MLDLIHHTLKEDTNITALTGAGSTTRIFPYFRQPDESTTYPAIHFEQDGSNTRHVLTQNQEAEGVAVDSFVVVVSCLATTLAEGWKLFHLVRNRMTTVPGYEVTLGDNKWTLLDGVFEEVQVDLLFGGDLAVVEGRFDVHTKYEFVG